MIHAKELRVGNLLDGGDGITFAIRDGEDIDDVVKYQSYTPIPLTEEWLFKFENLGKTDIDGEPSFFNGDNILIRLEDFSLFLHSELDGSVFFATRIEYIHQLQNLYYALTGEELTIKEAAYSK